ncbi:MAG TPA: cysteine--tRNA ligase [Alcanivoracaceae bacterium]|nr:cysteine--tRNA ligase [Alcanivoracaceae bacterium]
MTTLKIHNTLSGKKETFTPLNPQRVTMYVCGPTVYNYVHIGNARPVVAFDVFYRLLRHLYPNVVYARNITDIDDKIITAAQEEGKSIDALTTYFSAAFAEDMAALHALTPDITPHATEHVADMIAIIQTLIEKGHAYEAEGHVLFAVQSMEDYGKLSKRSLEDMLAGARVEVAPYKQYAGDFVLWKPSTKEQPGWDSPWGRGRPGWHIECTAMIAHHLGPEIDIHAGGQDLIFPHHENEIAQGSCAHDTNYVRYWMHNGYINIDGEKMSKSLGNFRLVRELLKHYKGEVLRFALLSAHYRSQLNFSEELLEQAEASLNSLYHALQGRDGHVEPAADYYLPSNHPVLKALCDDVNTPVAIRVLHELAGELNRADAAAKPALKAELLAAASLLGLLQEDPNAWFQGTDEEGALSAADIEALVQERDVAKKERDFARADSIRDELEAQGIVLEDTREGTRWSRS